MTEPEPPGSGGPPEPEPGLKDLGFSTGEVFSRQRPASHRADVREVPIIGRVLAPLTAVAVVALVIVLLIVINSHNSPQGGSTAAAGVPTHSATPTVSSPHSTPNPVVRSSGGASPSTAGQTGTSAHPSAPAKSSSSPNPSSSAKQSGSGQPSSSVKPSSGSTATAPPAATTAMAPVQVLNNSRRTGLAAAVASEAQAKGWTIALVGNLRGRVIEPTVYYSPGTKAAAKHLASEFSSIERISPAADLGITAPGLTLVLTESWSG